MRFYYSKKKLITNKQIKYLLLLLSSIAVSLKTFAQRGSTEFIDSENIENMERYANLNLNKFESWSIAIGIVLLIIAKQIDQKNSGIRGVLFVIGGFASLPLVLIILALIQKALGYAIILGLIVGGLYLLFGKKD